MKRAFYICIVIALFVSTGLQAQSSGSLDHYDNFKSEFVDARNVDIWLPQGYDSSKDETYPVIYMHDGQNLFNNETANFGEEWGIDEALAKLSNERKIPEAIVVGIWNTPKRYQEYMPLKPFMNMERSISRDLYDVYGGVPESDNYLKFMVEELKPFVDSVYNTKSNRPNTYVMGASMGGLISMYAVCEYPQIFMGAACLSTHWIGDEDANHHAISDAFVEYMKENLPDPGGHKFYFDYGTRGLDAYYEEHQQKVDQVMERKGYKQGKDWVTQKYKDHDHNEKSWRKRIDVPILFLLGYDK